MRYFKATFVWVIVLAAIAGYSYIDYESTRIEEKEKEEATRLLPFYPKDVLAIVINNEAGALELERWEEGWKIVSPIEAKADDESVEKFLGYVTDSRNDAEYLMDEDPTPERLAEFGLKDPKVSVTLKAGKELTPYTLVFGDRAPTKGVAFARLAGQKPVYRVLAYARAEADKDSHYFREKKVLHLSPVMIDQLSVMRPEGSMRFKLPDNLGKWVIEKPVEDQADNAKVFEFLGALANAEIKEFVAESKADLEQYGLDKPRAEALFWQAGDAEATIRLQVGDRNPEKRGYYCTISDRNSVFILEEEAVNAIPAKVNELRNRELFFFDKDNLKRIEIRQPDKSFVMVRDLEKEWRKDNEDGEVVDFNLVRDFLNELVAENIKDFVVDNPTSLKDYGLEPPSVQLLVWPDKSAVPVSLKLGIRSPKGYIYAMRSGKTSTVVELDASVKNLLTKFF